MEDWVNKHLPLATVIDKALARNLEDRFPHAGKLLAAIPKPRP